MPYAGTRALTYFTYLHSWLGRMKPAVSPKRLHNRAKATINGLYRVVHGPSIAAKMYDLD